MTEIEKIKDIENWKTTKEVAEVLSISPATIRRFYNDNKQLFEGLIMRSSGERSLSSGGILLWGPEAIKILMLNISNPLTDLWKEDVIEEVAEKGMVITSQAITKPENSLELIKLQSQQIILMVDEMQDIRGDIKELQEKAKEIYVTPRTRRELRDEVHRVSLEYFNEQHWKVWNPLKRHYMVNKYEELTEDQAKEILKKLREKCPPKILLQNKLKEISS